MLAVVSELVRPIELVNRLFVDTPPITLAWLWRVADACTIAGSIPTPEAIAGEALVDDACLDAMLNSGDVDAPNTWSDDGGVGEVTDFRTVEVSSGVACNNPLVC